MNTRCESDTVICRAYSHYIILFEPCESFSQKSIINIYYYKSNRHELKIICNVNAMRCEIEPNFNDFIDLDNSTHWDERQRIILQLHDVLNVLSIDGVIRGKESKNQYIVYLLKSELFFLLAVCH